MTSNALQMELRMNVAAIKRVDPYLKDILESASHVALYAFNGDNNEWEKTEIEGALFVYSRIGEPYHSILIMNRLNTKNQVEPILQGLDLQLQEPFLLYKNGKGDIYGIWFYDRDECMRISTILNKLTKESETSNKATPKNKKTMQKKSSNVDIFSMLSKAQEDYNSNKTGISEKTNKRMDHPKSPMTNALGELSAAMSATGVVPDGTSKSVIDFFRKAKVNSGQIYSAQTVRDQPQPGNGVNEGKPLLARLMSHPAAQTVENIEKQHRTVTPQPLQNPQNKMSTINNQSCEKSSAAKLQRQVNPNSSSGRIYCQEYSSSTINSNACNIMDSAEDMNIGFLRIQSPTANLANNVPNQHAADVNVSNYGDSCGLTHKQDSLHTNAFDSIFHHSSMSNANDDLITTPITPKSSTLTTSGTALALIPPGMFVAAASPAVPEPLRQIEPLTRNQLLQAFNYLLRSDPEFVNKLHEAYVKSLSGILS